MKQSIQLKTKSIASYIYLIRGEKVIMDENAGDPKDGSGQPPSQSPKEEAIFIFNPNERTSDKERPGQEGKVGPRQASKKAQEEQDDRQVWIRKFGVQNPAK